MYVDNVNSIEAEKHESSAPKRETSSMREIITLRARGNDSAAEQGRMSVRNINYGGMLDFRRQRSEMYVLAPATTSILLEQRHELIGAENGGDKISARK
jgi:hypothetical protein